MRQHFATFLAEQRSRTEHGFGLPRFVEREFERYVRCGILSEGFARVRCRACGDELLVALSCKGRGLCPSCGARRMHDTALHLVDRVIPRIPVRQWVLTFPPRLRACLAYDRELFSEAQTLFMRALFSYQRRRARELGLPTTRATTSGAVTFQQRLGSALQLTPHLHTILADGVFVADARDPDGRPRFHRLEPPDDDEVAAVLGKVVTSVLALARSRGCLDDDAPPPDDTLAPLLAEAVAVPSRTSRGSAPIPLGPEPLCPSRDGFSLHAGVVVHENDREGLLRLCQYGLRPPLALERLSEVGDGRLRYQLKRTFADGSHEILLSPEQLLRRLAAGIPRPRVHQTRYHGVFAPHARGRAALAGRSPKRSRASHPHQQPGSDSPLSSSPRPVSAADPLAQPPDPRDLADVEPLGVPPADPDRARRLPWAELLRRVHRVDVETCARCGGRLEVLAFITQSDVLTHILAHLGLPTEPPRMAPARAPPQLDLDLAEGMDGYFVDPPSGD